MTRSALLCALLALSGLSSARAQDCPCTGELPGPKKARKAAAAVFVGKVVKIRDNKGRHEVTFRVSAAWKGVKGKSAAVETSALDAMCGIEFEEDQAYLVYADGQPGSLWASSCSRTRPLAAAKEDLKALGPGDKR